MLNQQSQQPHQFKNDSDTVTLIADNISVVFLVCVVDKKLQQVKKKRLNIRLMV